MACRPGLRRCGGSAVRSATAMISSPARTRPGLDPGEIGTDPLKRSLISGGNQIDLASHSGADTRSTSAERALIRRGRGTALYKSGKEDEGAADRRVGKSRPDP